MLIPVGPGVAVSPESAPFPEMKLPMIMFPLMSSAGKPKAGPTCVWRATPGRPLPVSSFRMITLPETRPWPLPSRKQRTPESDTGKTVTCQFVPDDHVARDTALAITIRKKADSSAANLHAVVSGEILGHGIVVNAPVGSERRGAVARGRMRGKNDAAIERVVRDNVVDEHIVAALRSLVADEDSICIAGH